MNPSRMGLAVVASLLVMLGMAGCGAKTARETPGASAVSIKMFLVAQNDAGRSGPRIGCDDSLVAVERRIAPAEGTPALVRAALTDLLSLRDPNYGQSGLYNALSQSRLVVTGVTVQNGKAEILLSGTLTLGGTCDAPRVDAQLRQTALQFPGVTSVSIMIDSTPIEKTLSGQ